MKKSTVSLSLNEIYNLKSTINFHPIYQRFAPIWTKKQRQNFMLSLIQEYYIPPIVLRKCDTKSEYDYEVIDGQQRLFTLFNFRESRFQLPKETPKLNIGGKYFDIAEKKRKEFTTAVIKALDNLKIDAALLEQTDELAAITQFKRLNSGSPLTKAEYRNCILGKFRDMIDDFSKHDFFSSTKVRNKRGQLNTVCSQLFIMELGEGISELKADGIERMYNKYSNNISKEKITIFKKKLDLLNDIFEGKVQPYLTKGNVFNAYIVISFLMGKISFKDPETCSLTEEWIRTNMNTINRKLKEEEIFRIAYLDKRGAIIKDLMKKSFPVKNWERV